MVTSSFSVLSARHDSKHARWKVQEIKNLFPSFVPAMCHTWPQICFLPFIFIDHSASMLIQAFMAWLEHFVCVWSYQDPCVPARSYQLNKQPNKHWNKQTNKHIMHMVYFPFNSCAVLPILLPVISMSHCCSHVFSFCGIRMIQQNMIFQTFDTGIPSYLRGIKYPGIFQSYHLENTPHSSRILRQLVCTVTCMGFNGISESFFHLKTPYEALFCSQCITLLQ